MNAAGTSGRTMVIVAYKPKPGCEAELLELTNQHVKILRDEDLATKHPVTVCRAKDGTLIEVFEWEAGGIERAHSNEKVAALWQRYAKLCDIVPLQTLPEAGEMFAAFEPVVD